MEPRQTPGRSGHDCKVTASLIGLHKINTALQRVDLSNRVVSLSFSTHSGDLQVTDSLVVLRLVVAVTTASGRLLVYSLKTQLLIPENKEITICGSNHFVFQLIWSSSPFEPSLAVTTLRCNGPFAFVTSETLLQLFYISHGCALQSDGTTCVNGGANDHSNMNCDDNSNNILEVIQISECPLKLHLEAITSLDFVRNLNNYLNSSICPEDATELADLVRNPNFLQFLDIFSSSRDGQIVCFEASAASDDKVRLTANSELPTMSSSVLGLCRDPVGMATASISVVFGSHGNTRDEQANVLLAKNHSLLSICAATGTNGDWVLDLHLVMERLWVISVELHDGLSLAGFAFSLLYSIENLSMDVFEDKPQSFSRLGRTKIRKTQRNRSYGAVGQRLFVFVDDDPLSAASGASTSSDNVVGNMEGEECDDADAEEAVSMSRSREVKARQPAAFRGGGVSDIGALLASQRLPFLQSRVDRVLETLLLAAVEVANLLDPPIAVEGAMKEAENSPYFTLISIGE